jgi:hypothetical protein
MFSAENHVTHRVIDFLITRRRSVFLFVLTLVLLVVAAAAAGCGRGSAVQQRRGGYAGRHPTPYRRVMGPTALRGHIVHHATTSPRSRLA